MIKRIIPVIAIVMCLVSGCAEKQNNGPDSINKTKEKNAEYIIFNCDGTYLGSRTDENYFWKMDAGSDFSELDDGHFAIARINATVTTGGIAGIHDIKVTKVGRYLPVSLEDLKNSKGESLMRFNSEHPFVAGVSVYKDYVIARNDELYYVYKDNEPLCSFNDINSLTDYITNTEDIASIETPAKYPEDKFDEHRISGSR